MKKSSSIVNKFNFKNDSKYRIYQVKDDNSLSKYVESDTTTEDKTIYILKNHVSFTLDQFIDLSV